MTQFFHIYNSITQLHTTTTIQTTITNHKVFYVSVSLTGFWARPAKPGRRYPIRIYRPSSGRGRLRQRHLDVEKHMTPLPPPLPLPAGKACPPGAPGGPPAPALAVPRCLTSAARSAVLTAGRAAGAESPPDASARRPAHPAGGTGPGQAGPVTDESGEAGAGNRPRPDPAAPGSESPALSRRPGPGGPVGPHRGDHRPAVSGDRTGQVRPSIGDGDREPFLNRAHLYSSRC